MNIQRIMTETLFRKVVLFYKEELKKLHNRPGVAEVKIVYIAGKVTGLEYTHVRNKFALRESQLAKQGYVVINPCDLIDEHEDWQTAMKICVSLLSFADFISLLDDWQDSEGATLERHLADKFKIPLLPFNGFQ